jgi:hypothetical protein
MLRMRAPRLITRSVRGSRTLAHDHTAGCSAQMVPVSSTRCDEVRNVRAGDTVGSIQVSATGLEYVLTANSRCARFAIWRALPGIETSSA